MGDQAASQRESWWVLQAQSGSHEALNELFKSIQEPLFRYIVSLVRDQHLAEDILQEVFIRIYRKLRERIERSERNVKLAFLGAAIIELAFIVTFLFLADLSNRLHLLLLISTISCYSIVVLGLVALGEHINRSIGRVLKAVELGHEKAQNDQ